MRTRAQHTPRRAALAAVALIASSCTTFTWGNNDAGQLGDGTTTDRTAPAAIAMPGGTGALWTDIDAGTRHACEVRVDRTLWCWGSNTNAQLGDGTTTDRSVPTQAQGAGWSTVAAGEDYTCAIKTDHSLWCWGANQYGQLGDGTAIDRTAPTQVGTATDWQTVAASINRFDVAFPQVPDLGGAHTCAIKADHSLWCWGANDFGQLGTGTPDPGQLQPTQIEATHHWSQVALGNLQTCAVRSDGTLWCTGAGVDEGVQRNSFTQVGADADWHQLTIGAAWGLFEGDGFAVWAVAHHGCGIKTNGTLWCWGWNSRGQVGVAIVNHLDHLIPPSGAFEFEPVQVGSANDWIDIDAGAINTCGLRAPASGSSTSVNEAWCWGEDAYQPAMVDLDGKQPAEIALGLRFRIVLTF